MLRKLSKRQGFAFKAFLLVIIFNLFPTALHAKKEKITKPIEDFQELEVSNAVTVILRRAQKDEKLEASIELEGIDAERLLIRDKGNGILSISLKKKIEFEVLSVTKKQKAVVHLTYKQIGKIRLKNAAILSMENVDDEISFKTIEITVENAGNVSLSKIACEELKVVARSASKVKIGGKTVSANILSSSASSVDLQALQVQNAEVDASSASNTSLGSIENLKAKINSVAKVSYQGQPKISELQVECGGILKKA